MIIALPDTSLIRNFDAIGRLDLVERFCAPTAASWAYDVRVECDHQGLDCDHLDRIFGDVVYADARQRQTARTFRSAYFADGDGSASPHLLKDMGECVTLAIWSERAGLTERIALLTEDRSVVRFCRYTLTDTTDQARAMSGRKVRPVTSADLLRALVTRDQSAGADGGFDDVAAAAVEQAIRAAGRPWLGPAMSVTF